jgi:hypothetical protein
MSAVQYHPKCCFSNNTCASSNHVGTSATATAANTYCIALEGTFGGKRKGWGWGGG